MAHQHFYSRVPSRVSLFNKRDGFDTFAHSAGLSREFILDELSVMYRDKLEIHSPAKLRRGEIPRVYSQAMLPSGKLAQTVISYLPKDFTGERSAYLAHTLIPTEDEADGIFNRNGFCAFNPDMFVGNISAFDLTARDAVANPAMSEREYMPSPLLNGKAVISLYNAEMVKSFIYSLVVAIMGEGRAVYFRLPHADSEVSDKALDFINAIIGLLPFSLRKKVSFVTYVSDVNSYDGFILKGVGSDCKAVSPENGVFYDFAAGQVIGQSSDYHHYHGYAAFLYSLLDYPKIMDDYHVFIANIEEKHPELILTTESLSDLTFMFWQCSGFYVESSVIVDDQALCRFLDVYSAYRDAIAENYRVQAYRPFARYLNEQIAIPDGVFSRLSRLYPTECVEAKAVALDVLLGLIHVDVMRERLFAFISRNYPTEIPSVKEVINANLSRVFYGGFLQHRILGHFELNFAKEPVSTKDIIIDKLLLSIRTPEGQDRIISFMDRYYRLFSSAQRLKLCTTCLEMIPECDELSVKLIDLVNRRLAQDTDIARMLATGLIQSLDYRFRAGDYQLCALLIDKSGFCESVAASHILVNNVGVDILIALLSDMPAHKRVHKLINIANLNCITDESYVQLLSAFGGRPVRVTPSTMYDIISADSEAQSLGDEMHTALRQYLIYPAILHTFLDVFKMELGADGIAILGSFVDSNPALASTAEYGVVLNYLSMIRLCDGGDTEGAFKLAVTLPEDEGVRRNIANHIKNHQSSALDDTAECTYKLMLQYLGEGAFAFDQLYSDYQKQYEEGFNEAGGIKSKIIASDRRGAAEAVKLIIDCASDICNASSLLGDLVCDDQSGLREALSEFVKIYGLGAGMLFKKCTEEAYFAIGDITEELIEDRNASIGSVEDAVNLVFRKK